MTASRPPQADSPDEGLLASFRAGDDRAFGLLFDRYNPRLTTYALRMLRRREEAEEICTETFVRVVEGRAPVGGSVAAWLFTITHRLCLDRLRARSRHARLLQWFGWSMPGPPSPEDVVSLDQRAGRLLRAIGDLGDEHRAVVWLTYAEGLSGAEVATVVGKTEQQVRSKLTYARTLLRDALEDGDGG